MSIGFGGRPLGGSLESALEAYTWLRVRCHELSWPHRGHDLELSGCDDGSDVYVGLEMAEDGHVWLLFSIPTDVSSHDISIVEG